MVHIVAILYIIGTPIGNLGDITLRAIQTLQQVEAVFCEDTRHTLQLLNHLKIKKPLVSCRSQNEEIASEKALEFLKNGKDIAFASDAGTPGISDPGALLVQKVQDAGFVASPIPGASAFTALISVAGLVGKTVTMEGFLSIKAGKRKTRLCELFSLGHSFVLYESPYRVLKLLHDIVDIDSGVRLVIGREMTKIHEEILAGTASSLLKDFEKRQKIQGEFAILVCNKC